MPHPTPILVFLLDSLPNHHARKGPSSREKGRELHGAQPCLGSRDQPAPAQQPQPRSAASRGDLTWTARRQHSPQTPILPLIKTTLLPSGHVSNSEHQEVGDSLNPRTHLSARHEQTQARRQPQHPLAACPLNGARLRLSSNSQRRSHTCCRRVLGTNPLFSTHRKTILLLTESGFLLPPSHKHRAALQTGSLTKCQSPSCPGCYPPRVSPGSPTRTNSAQITP